jgi:hypothetical protein
MTDRRGAVAFWLAVGAAGFLVVPWYALQDSVFTLGWVPHFTAKEAAPAWLQATTHGRVWLAPLGALLAAVALLLAPGLARTLRANALIAIGAAGFAYFFAQGFAIGPTGWYLDTLGAALPPLTGGQYGMGLGAVLVVAAFAMLFAVGLAGRGFFKGDAFVAGSGRRRRVAGRRVTFFPCSASCFGGRGRQRTVRCRVHARLTTEKIWARLRRRQTRGAASPGTPSRWRCCAPPAARRSASPSR